MKIRDKLFLGFGLYVLLAVILGFFAYKELRTIGKRLTLIETADDIKNALLEARRYEKNYLLYKDVQSLKAVREYLNSLKLATENIAAEIKSEIGPENYDMMRRDIAEYERILGVLTENAAHQQQFTKAIRQLGRNAELSLPPEKHEAFLNLRRHEKNVMLYKDVSSYSGFRTALETGAFNDEQDVLQYANLISGLHFLYQEERDAVEKMRKTAREIQAFTESISHQERADIAATLRMSIMLLFIALGLIVVIGIAVNIKLAKSIVTPIQNLERITKKIAWGDFSESLAVAGKDELSSLAESFNKMEQKLDHTMGSLEETIKKLLEKQAQLVEAEKLASIGKLAAGIAHEINNPLTSVLTFSNLMLEQCPPGDPRYERLKLMAREADRARTIVRQLLNFGRESAIQPVKININQPVTEITESLVAQGAFKDIALFINLAEDLPDVYVDPAQIGQVVLNILLNAIHAITPPGRIDVITRRVKDVVEIVFSDTGKGITQEHLHKIFDPFFSTKGASKGTGLGLAVSYGIIKKHGGDIAVESEEGKGTTFFVRLPIYG